MLVPTWDPGSSMVLYTTLDHPSSCYLDETNMEIYIDMYRTIQVVLKPNKANRQAWCEESLTCRKHGKET